MLVVVVVVMMMTIIITRSLTVSIATTASNLA
jgi:hypothetical protein